MKRKTAALLLILLAATASAQSDTARLDPLEAKEVAQALDGKTPGKPIDCVSALPGTNLSPAGDHVLLYRQSKRLVYRNDLTGACRGLHRGDALVMDVHGDQYCRGDIVRAVDLTTGIWGGSCALGAFVPYTSSGK